MVLKLGSELVKGDTIKVWWAPNKDTIMKIKSYKEPLENLFPKGVSIAKFLINKSGMTIDHDDYYNVIEDDNDD